MHRIRHRRALLGAAALALAACSPSPNPSSGFVLPATITATPFRPVAPSPTPAEVTLWIAPEIPVPVAERVLGAAAASDIPLRQVETPGEASVRLEPDGAETVADWTYALVAPFPTVEDGMSIEALRAAWTGEGGPPIFIEDDDAPALKLLLGVPGQNVVVGSEGALLDAAWSSRPSRAIIPFDALEPRWKVLQLNGTSILNREEDLTAYPLELSLGLSGAPEAIEWFRSSLETSEGTVPIVNRSPQRMTTLVMTGVTALTRATAWQMDRSGMTFPARDIGDWLRTADITHISNEVSFTEACPDPIPDQTRLLFCSSPRHIALLEEVGTDVVELTGNHVLDAGEQAFLGSLDLYRERGWVWFGGGTDLDEATQPALFEHNGNRIALLGCNEAGPVSAWAAYEEPGATPCGPDRLKADITALRESGYLPIFTFQWHEHYAPTAPASQREAFLAAAQAGAVGVSGSQAHQPQGFAFRDGAFIHYGLGNLFFDQMWSNAVRQEFIDRYVFHDGRLISVELLTAYLEDWARPRPMTPEERAAFLDEMFRASGW